MARMVKGGNKETKRNEIRTAVEQQPAEVNGNLSSRQSADWKLMPDGGEGLEEQNGELGHLHRQISERAFLLYEQSGFQEGRDLEHWLEAERQVKMLGVEAS